MVVIACLGAMHGWQILQTEKSPGAAAEGWTFTGFFARINRHGCSVGGPRFHCIFDDPALLLTLSPDLQSQFKTIITTPSPPAFYLRFRCHFTPGNDGHQSPEETYQTSIATAASSFICALFHHISPYDRKFGNGGVGNRFTAGHSPLFIFSTLPGVIVKK